MTRLLGARLGSVNASNGRRVEADATLENSPAVLFDGVILPAVCESLVRAGQAVEFVKDQYRHCKTILAMGGATALLDKAGIDHGDPDEGLIMSAENSAASKAFIAALGKHRHPSRDRDVPVV